MTTGPAITPRVKRDEAALAAVTALGVVRRAMVEGTPVTRDGLAREASYILGEAPLEALRELDATAQRLGVASLL
jgi:hypothetical protein